MAKSERYTVVRMIGQAASEKVTDRWTFRTRQLAYDFIAATEVSDKFEMTDAVKLEAAEDAGEEYLTEKLDGGVVYVANPGADQIDDRVRQEILCRIGGQTSTSGTELVAVVGDTHKLMGLHNFATKLVKAEDENKLVVALFALNPDAKRQKRQLLSVREATDEELAKYFLAEIFKVTNLDADEVATLGHRVEEHYLETLAS
jgi:hypothetical protein